MAWVAFIEISLQLQPSQLQGNRKESKMSARESGSSIDNSHPFLGCEKRPFHSMSSYAIQPKYQKSTFSQTENAINCSKFNEKSSTFADSTAFSSIQNSIRLVDQSLINDQNMGSSSNVLESVASFSSLDYGSDRLPGFVKKRFYALPKQIQEQADAAFENSQGKSTSFIGVFAELKYAWAAIDNRLFLWDFENESDFVSYEELNEPIIKVSIANPKKNVFVNTIKKVLIIATPSRICLLGIVCKDEKSLSLRKTGFEIVLGGFLAMHIQSTDDGRIFVAGDDGHLYEVTYDSEERWFKKRCDIKDRTSNWLKKILPAKTRESQIKGLSYDASRHLIFAFNSQNEIRIFKLKEENDNEDDAFVQIAKISKIYDQLEEKSKTFQTARKDFSLISIHPISRYESKSYFLVAISAEGYRIYFSFMGDSLSGKSSQISVSHIRFTPEESSIKSQSPISKKYTRAVYSSGVFIGCVGYADETFSVSFAVPNYPRIIGRTPNYPLELWTESLIEDEILAISEYSSTNVQDRILTRTLKTLNNSNFSNELLSQHFKAPLEFLLVTNLGIEHVRKIRPIDKLQILIVESKGIVTDGIRAFFDDYKLEQSCAMCISLACENSSRFSSANLPNVDLYTWSISILSRFGGEPQLSELRFSQSISASSSSSINQGDIGFALAAPEISFSPLHNALYLCLSRISRPILKSKLGDFFVQSEDIMQNSVLLMFILKQLQDLKNFITKNESLFFKQETLIYSTSKNRDQAIRKEKESILNLLMLTERIIEAISFYLFFLDHGSYDFCDQNALLFDISFESFISTQKGLESSREIVNSILVKEIKQDRSVSAMCETLKAKCPSFFTQSDILYYQASESLYRALTTKSQREREEALNESLRLYIQTPAFISCEKFLQISKNFASLSFYTGIISLGLSIANALDPEQLGYSYLKESKENSSIAHIYQSRCNVYEIIFRFISPLISSQSNESLFVQECTKLCTSNQDNLFHWKYFEFLIKNNSYEQLISSNSPVAESFLLELFKQLLTQQGQKERLDLLWKYYVQRGKGMEASQVLYTLADSPRSDLFLKQRMEYLSLGIATAKSLIKEPITRDQIIKQIEEQLEVARIQTEIIHLLSTTSSIQPQQAKIAVSCLEKTVLDFSTLYNKYVKPLKLPEAALLILKSAHFDDSSVIVTAWQEIIDRDSHDLSLFKRSFLYLAKFLHPSSKVFPVHFLVNAMCKISKERNMVGWIVDVFRISPVPMSILFIELEKLYYSKSGIWSGVEGKSFILRAIGYLTSIASQDLKVRSELSGIKELSSSLANLLSNAGSIFKENERAAYDEFELSYRRFTSIKN